MLVMELHFFERLTVTYPPFVSEQELHFGGCVQKVPSPETHGNHSGLQLGIIDVNGQAF